MDRYQGVTRTDVPSGGGAYVKEHGFGYEAFNFMPVGGQYFGYVQPVRDTIKLHRLGGSRDDESLTGVTVAWVATHPAEGGIRIVGWYLNATVFAQLQEPEHTRGRRLPSSHAPMFLVRARKVVLLDRDEHVFEVPHGKGGMGRSNVWYPGLQDAARVLTYIRRGGVTARARKHSGTAARLNDVERRLRIERTPMTAAAEWFVRRGYMVEDVSAQRFGWDLKACQNRAQLKIEVKGTSKDEEEFAVELTPNEYRQMTSRQHRSAYRLCVVTSCESKSPLVTVYAWSNETETWSSGDGERHLAIDERVAGRISRG